MAPLWPSLLASSSSNPSTPPRILCPSAWNGWQRLSELPCSPRQRSSSTSYYPLLRKHNGRLPELHTDHRPRQSNRAGARNAWARDHAAHVQTRVFQNPDIRDLFNQSHHGEIGSQPKALAAGVIAYARNIDNLGALASRVERIAQKACRPEYSARALVLLRHERV